MTTPRFATALVLLASVAAAQEEGADPRWHGFARDDFALDGVACTLVSPEHAAAGRPWIWRARFFGHEPQADLELLRRGFHLAYVDVAGLFGNDEAVRRFDLLYDHLIGERGLASRVALEGMSRGGLPVVHWASRHPGRVACIYADAPVCDVRSWPGGMGEGRGAAAEWARCREAWGLADDAAVQAFAGNPIDRLGPLAEAEVPLLFVCGTADEVVPYAENTAVLAERYRALDGPIEVIEKEGVGHHPHSLEDPTPIVDFVLRHTRDGLRSIEPRGGLPNAHRALAAGGPVRVAFLGGSITWNPGWRDLVGAELARRFPEAELDLVNAGIPSMGSTPGAFRMRRDALGRGPVDLLFVEAAVNDSTNGRSELEMLRGMEGIVRGARLENPRVDVVMLHFVDPKKMEAYRSGAVPAVVAQHERVAERYAVPSIDLAREVTARIDAGEMTWKEDFRDLHPSPFGQRLYAATIRRLFDRVFDRELAEPAERPLPDPLDSESYSHGRLLGPEAAGLASGWRVDPSWRPTAGGTRRGFVDVPTLVGDGPGGVARLAFDGRAIGVLVAAGPDAGQLEHRVDGEGEWRTTELFTRWSGGLHLPWVHVLATGLGPGEHVLELRVAEGRHDRSRGRVARIQAFCVDGGG